MFLQSKLLGMGVGGSQMSKCMKWCILWHWLQPRSVELFVCRSLDYEQCWRIILVLTWVIFSHNGNFGLSVSPPVHCSSAEISWQLLDGLPWNLVQASKSPFRWIRPVITQLIPCLLASSLYPLYFRCCPDTCEAYHFFISSSCGVFMGSCRLAEVTQLWKWWILNPRNMNNVLIVSPLALLVFKAGQLQKDASMSVISADMTLSSVRLWIQMNICYIQVYAKHIPKV